MYSAIRLRLKARSSVAATTRFFVALVKGRALKIEGGHIMVENQRLPLVQQVAVGLKDLLQDEPDRLMVINGGYPGGDSCRAAGISWGIFSGKPHSIHNYHSMVVAPSCPFAVRGSA